MIGKFTVLREEMRSMLACADHILVALDFEWTLPVSGVLPRGAKIGPAALELLQEIAGLETCSLAIFSDRSVADLKGRIGLDVSYVGNHGLEIAGPRASFVHPVAASLRECVDWASWDLEAAFEMVRGVSVQRNGLSITVHLDDVPRDLWNWVETTTATTIRPYEPGLRLIWARNAWQIRPAVEWNRASALKILLAHLPCRLPAVVCAGDGWIDDDLAGLAGEAIAIKVGRQIEIQTHDRADQGPDLTASAEEFSPARDSQPVVAAIPQKA